VTSYHLYNPHGDTSALTDQNGAIAGSYRSDSFGNPISGNPPANGYTGKWQREKDSSTGTIRMGVREYDPALGRFISADPLKGAAMNPQQRNRYPYAINDPMTVYDLSGKSPDVQTYYDLDSPPRELGSNEKPEARRKAAYDLWNPWNYWNSNSEDNHYTNWFLDQYYPVEGPCAWWDFHAEGDRQWHCHQVRNEDGTTSIDWGNWLLQQNGVDEVPGHPESRHIN
jgi:RHS repeat-associated protein